MIRSLLAAAVIIPLSITSACAARPPAPTFRIHLPQTIPQGPSAGRLILWFIAGDAEDLSDTDPADGPFLDHPQPIVAVDIARIEPGAIVSLSAAPGAGVDAFQGDRFAQPGTWRVQAVLDRVHANSAWRREPGNLFSEPVPFTIHADAGTLSPIDLTLSHAIEPEPLPEAAGLEWFSMRSALLSDFAGRDVLMRAGVVLPRNYDPSRRYPTVYYVPGFGGDHRFAARFAAMAQSDRAPKTLRDLLTNAFLIVLDPESPNGHTLFADSGVNGPRGEALTSELIPALEAKYPLIPQASARAVRGHSSGGWAAVWLPLKYPQTFAYGFASSPDPIDFRAFQEANVYADNFYTDADANLLPSNIKNGAGITTIAMENAMEQVMGPHNTSANQWDSWLSVFGPPAASGLPGDLYDPATGAINRRIATQWQHYDIGRLLRDNPDHYGPLFANHIRIVVGDQDQWSLHKAVILVKHDLDSLGYDTSEEADPPGYITIVPGFTHGSIMATPQVQSMTAGMLDAFRAAGHVK